MSASLREQVRFQVEQLKRLLDLYQPLLSRGAKSDLEAIEAASVGAMLHSFYNGAENIFKSIARQVDGGLPGGEFWHTELLDAMAQPRPHRPAVISAGLCEQLKDYLQFRHVFRSAYVFVLRWDKMAPLATEAESVLKRLESELHTFLGLLKDSSL